MTAAPAILAGVALVACANGAPRAEPPAPRIVVEPSSDGRARFRLQAPGRDVADGRIEERTGRGLLRVAVAGGGAPLLGRYRGERGTVVFEPLGPLAVGALVVATAPGAAPARYVRARPRASPPVVLDVAPHLAEIPANTLRLHLDFSEPMAGGPGIFDRIVLQDAQGRRIDEAFRRTERWSPDRRALTLLFHPGRIKRDIPFAAGMEPLLVPGETVRLVIDGLTDAEGEGMGAPFVRSFVVGPPDAAGPSLSEVSAALSPEGVLRVDFSEPIDAVVAPAALRVTVGEEAHSCAWRVLPSERTIVCALPERRPDAPVEVEVTCDLEDLAGNRPAHPFDAPAGASRPCRSLRMSVRGG